MPEMTTYKPGTPSWIEYSSPDLDASIGFYGDLFGWEVPESENAEQTGGYRIATKGDRPAAGMMPKMEEAQPTVWATYVSVDDAEAIAAAVGEAGGATIVEPMAVMDLGTMGVFSDPGGAVFGVWQPGAFQGAGVVNEPGAIAWNELNTRDLGGAEEFYGAVFGWEFQTEEMGADMGSYTTITLDGDPVGGILDMEEREVPEMVPPHWQVYFAVEDTDATIESVKGAGGGVMVEPIDIPAGRFSIVTDPHGASFGVIALAEG